MSLGPLGSYDLHEGGSPAPTDNPELGPVTGRRGTGREEEGPRIDIGESIRAHAPGLRWAAVLAWVLIGAGAVRLASSHRGRSRWVWLVVAALALGFAIDAAVLLRLAASGWLRETVRAVGGPEVVRGRRTVQAAVIVGLVLPLTAYLMFRGARARTLSRSAKLALLGCGIGAVGLVVEGISFHYLDQIRSLYPALRGTALVLVAAGVVRALRWPDAGPGF